MEILNVLSITKLSCDRRAVNCVAVNFNIVVNKWGKLTHFVCFDTHKIFLNTLRKVLKTYFSSSFLTLLQTICSCRYDSPTTFKTEWRKTKNVKTAFWLGNRCGRVSFVLLGCLLGLNCAPSWPTRPLYPSRVGGPANQGLLTNDVTDHCNQSAAEKNPNPRKEKCWIQRDNIIRRRSFPRIL